MEIWKDIEEFKGLYQVSDKGHFRSLDRKIKHVNQYANPNVERIAKGKRIKICTRSGSKDYVNFHVDGKVYTRSASKTVAEAFIPNPQGYRYVMHIDGNINNRCAENLRWTKSRNHSKPITINGIRYSSISEAGRILNPDTNIGTISRRISAGWEIELAITVKTHKGEGRRPKFYNYRGKLYTRQQLADMFNIPLEVIKSRLRYGWSVEEAVEIPITRVSGRRKKSE